MKNEPRTREPGGVWPSLPSPPGSRSVSNEYEQEQEEQAIRTEQKWKPHA